MDDATQSSVELLVRMTGDMKLVVTLQLIAAILMIVVEACLLWAILSLTRTSRRLSWDLALMLDNMGWSKGEHADRMAKTQQFVEDRAEAATAAGATDAEKLDALQRAADDGA